MGETTSDGRQRPYDARIVVLDLETTGLSPDVDRILEVGAIVIESDLRVPTDEDDVNSRVSSKFLRVVRQSTPLGQLVQDHKVYEMHVMSGLAADLKSPELCTAVVGRISEVEADLISWLKEGHFFEAKAAVIAGNSIHQDRAFIRRWMPDLDQFLHYRMIDVSAMREAYRRWFDPQFPEKWRQRWGNTKHRTLPDCQNSINELVFFRSAMSKADPDLP